MKPIRRKDSDPRGFKTSANLQPFMAAIVAHTEDTVIAKSLDGTICFWNPSAERLFGYTAEEAIGRPITLIIPPELQEKESRILEKIRRGERMDHYETVRMTRDDRQIEVSLTVSPIYDESGRIIGASKILRDISDRKQTERELERLRTRAEADFRGMKHLHRISNRLVNKENMTSLFEEIIRAAVAVVEADKGAVQILNSEAGSLAVAAQVGFDSSFIQRIGTVSGGRLASGAALQTRERIIVEDITKSSLYDHTPVREILLSDAIRSVQATPLLSRSGELLGVLSTHHAGPGRPPEDRLRLLDLIARQAADFIDLLQAERSLAESRLRFETIFNNLGEAAIFANKNRRIVLVNPAFTKTFGYESKEALGRTPRFLYEDSSEFDRQGRKSYRPGPKPESKPFEIRYRRKDGSCFWAETLAVQVRDPKDEHIGYLGLHRDITDRKRDEDALRESEARLSLSLRASGSGVWDWNLITDAVWCSPEMGDVWGPDIAGNITGKQAMERVADEDRDAFVQRLQETWDNREEWKHEFRIDHPVHGRRWIAALGRTYYDETERPVRMIGINFDNTDRRETEEALKELNESLEKRVAERTEESRRLTDQLRALAAELTRVEQRERTRLAKILHEDLQQLLTAARLKTDWMTRHTEKKDPEPALQEVAAILDQAVKTSRSLTEELSPPILSDAGLIGGLNWLAARMAEKYRLQVMLCLDPAAEPPAEEIRLMLFQAVRELLLNVARYAGVEEARVSLERSDTGSTRLTVSDHGKGFDPQTLDGAGSDDGGTYGLFSIQQRLTHLGGRMELTAKPGSGVTVTLFAPTSDTLSAVNDPEPAAPRIEKAADIHPEKKPAETIRILLADDHKILREGLAELLGAEPDFRIVGQAEDGHQAVELTKKHRPDVVVMDINMPGINGIEATRILSRTLPETRIIGLSMHVDPHIAKTMREAGAVAYFSKGEAAGGLVEAIRACVGKNGPSLD